MKTYGAMRKKMNLLSFLLGVSIVSLLWLYTVSFLPVGNVNGELIYQYQLKECQKKERYNQMRAIIDIKVKEQAERDYRKQHREGESFNEYFERYKHKTAVTVY